MNTDNAKERMELVSGVKSSLNDLVKSGQTEEAEKLLKGTRVGEEQEGWNASLCEQLGDECYSTDTVAADWFYSESLRWWEKFAGGATDRADAIARGSAGALAQEKRQYLRAGAAWPYVQEIPEEAVLKKFLSWAESSCLREFALKELGGKDWAGQAARVVAFLEDSRSPKEMVYQLGYIPLRIYGSYGDPTGILASWLRLSLPRLAAERKFTPELEDYCRNVDRDKDPASEEIAALVKAYLGAADAAPAKDEKGNRRRRSVWAGAPSTAEDLAENVIERAGERSGAGEKLRGLRAGSAALRSKFLARFANSCSADEACELIYLLVSEGQAPQGAASRELEQWGQVVFEAIARRGLRAPDMLRHCLQGVIGREFPQGLRGQIVAFLLSYGPRLDGYRETIASYFGYDLYSSGTLHAFGLPASPKTWHEWEYEGWASGEREWPLAVLLFALDPPAEREMLDVLEAPLDAGARSPMFLPSLVLFHLWEGAGVSVEGLRAVAQHMEIARGDSRSGYLYDRAVLVFDKWWPGHAGTADAELREAAAEVGKAIEKLEGRLGKRG